jgi:tetratricopeptide (TPR) repeat protein
MLLHSRFFLGLNFGNQGHISEALSSLQKTMEMAQRDGDQIVLARVPNSMGWLHRELNNFDEAMALDQRSSDIAGAHHVTEAEANSLINLSHDYTLLHDSDSALRALKNAETVFKREQWNHWRFHHIRFHAGAAEYYLSQQDYIKAREHADTLLKNSTRYEVPKYMAIAHKLIAEILSARSIHGGGESVVRGAVKARDQSGSAFDVADLRTAWRAAFASG